MTADELDRVLAVAVAVMKEVVTREKTSGQACPGYYPGQAEICKSGGCEHCWREALQREILKAVPVEGRG